MTSFKSFANVARTLKLFRVLATLAKLLKLVILKLGLRNISKMIKSLLFLLTYFPPQHTLVDSYNFLSFKIIDKANSKFDLKS